MQSEPSRTLIENYYDARIDEKMSEFVHSLPRIEAAIETLAEWAPPNRRRVLEIGCGIGATCWRMARAWPKAEVVGIDLSLASIEVANTCFKLPNLTYRVGLASESMLSGQFDLILMMDVYEHIAASERLSFHAWLKQMLSEESRIIIMAPTPAHQRFLRIHHPKGLQPIDEDIDLKQIAALAEEVEARVLYYREVGVWHYGDYFHVVIGRSENLPGVALRQSRYRGPTAVKQLVKQVFGCSAPVPAGRKDFFGTDFLRPQLSRPARQFQVSVSERRRLASAWQSK